MSSHFEFVYDATLSQSYQGQLSSQYNAWLSALIKTDSTVAEWIGYLYYQSTDKTADDLQKALDIVEALKDPDFLDFALTGLFSAAQSKNGPVDGGLIDDPVPTLSLLGVDVDLTGMMGGLDTAYWTTTAGKTGTQHHTREFFGYAGEPQDYDADWMNGGGSGNQAPTGINFVPTDGGSNENPGYFQAVDPDEGDTHTYSLVDANGDPVSITGINLNADTGELSFAGHQRGTVHQIIVRVTDQDGEFFDVPFTLLIGTNDAETISDATFVLAGTDNIMIGANGGDTITGSAGNDYILGGNGDDIINGGAGNDIIVGGAGQDTLTGGDGDDTFKFITTDDSSNGKPNTITDWGNGNNKIDVSMIDANTSTGSNDDFIWGGLTPTANGVWYAHEGGNTIIRLDVNGNTDAEMRIILLGEHVLTEDHFIGVA